MKRVGPLVVELTGSLRQRQQFSPRPPVVVMAELGAALSEVHRAAPELVPRYGPRTRRGRLAAKAVKSAGTAVARKASGWRSPRELPDETGLDEPGGDGELDAVAAAFADIAADESIRVAHFDIETRSN
jgi:hypothetical protein